MKLSIYFTITIGIFIGCGKSKYPILRQLPEISLDTLQDSTLSTERLISYLRKRSLQDSQWEDAIGTHYLEFSPVFIRGIAGNLTVQYVIPNGSYVPNHNYVEPSISHRTYVWTSQRSINPALRMMNPIYAHGKGFKNNTSHPASDVLPLIFADDSVAEAGWPIEPSRWSKRQIYDSLIARLSGKPADNRANSLMLKDGFAIINRDSEVSIEFFTLTNLKSIRH